MVVNSKGVLNFDPVKREGFYELATGGYSFDSLTPGSNSFVIGLTNNAKRKIALRVDQTKQNTDSIDKKVSELQRMAEVLFVSTYGNYIYVSANLGDLVYDPATGSYVYSQEVKKVVEAKINAEIDRLGIDRKIYTITSNAF